LYEGGEQRIYQFKESASRGGTIDILFNHGRLENFKANLYFEGVWGKAGAVIFSSLRFAPLMNTAVGRGNVHFDAATHQFFCHFRNLVVSYTHNLELGLPSITTSILFREGCPAGVFSANEPLRFSTV